MTDFPTPYLSNDLKDRVALVTGTTSGLGRRFALVLAACGAKVALTGRRAERLDELAKEIRESGGTCHPIPFDITDEKQIPEVVDKAQKELGLVDILVNNAGIPDAQRAHKMSNEFTDLVFGTNLIGPWSLSCEVARRLIEAKKPIVKPVKKKDFFIEVLFKPNVFKIAISFVLFFINIVRPEIMLNAATIIIKVSIINMTFLSTLRALKKDLFKSAHV